MIGRQEGWQFFAEDSFSARTSANMVGVVGESKSARERELCEDGER